MKRAVYTATILSPLLLFAVLLSCSPAESALSSEAERKGQEYFDRALAKCGDGHYTVVRWSDVDTINSRINKHETLLQLRDPVASVKEEPLTQADELNGIEWKGWIVFTVAAHKERHDFQKSWSDWSNGVPRYLPVVAFSGSKPMLDTQLRKQNGQWNVDAVDTEPRVSKPDCSEIPPG